MCIDSGLKGSPGAEKPRDPRARNGHQDIMPVTNALELKEELQEAQHKAEAEAEEVVHWRLDSEAATVEAVVARHELHAASVCPNAAVITSQCSFLVRLLGFGSAVDLNPGLCEG